MAKFTKKKLCWILEFNRKHQQKIGIPNDIFEILSKDEELMKAKAPHVAVAYTYIYLVSWLYKYAKYSLLNETTDVSKIKEILGFSPIEKRINYIIKKDGVLDRLGITKTVNFKEAPVEFVWEDGVFLGFVSYEEWIANQDSRDIEEIKAIGVNYNTKRKQIKYPIFGLDDREINGEEIPGTFYEWGYSHAVSFDVFIECMTNDDLGYTAFYIYAYLCSRCGMNGGQIEVSLDRIIEVTGIRQRTLNKYLGSLKAYGLVKCYPTDYVIGKGEIETGASVYEVVEKENLFNKEPTKFIKRNVMTKKHYEKRQKVMKEFENAELFNI